MRAGIRKQLLESVLSLKECYEPNVPKPKTPKPYAVVLQGSDTEKRDPTSFERKIEVWLYNDIDTFKTLDALQSEVIEALDLVTFTDPETMIAYTTKFNNVVGQDMVDEEWGAIVRGLNFSVISIYEDEVITNDEWISAISSFINIATNKKVYENNWRSDFQVPSILCRTISSNSKSINMASYKKEKEVRIHVVSKSRNEELSLMDKIEESLISAIKIPLNVVDNTYLTIDSIREDRDSDMLGTGQITVNLSRINSIKNDYVYINKTHGRGKIE